MVSSIKKKDRIKCHRYKGIENLLRKIAFNLGNTPSQTEVKIISCIPIDVTDLQEKIISLERQLEQTKGQDQQPPNRTGPQVVYPLTINSARLRVLYPQKSNKSGNGSSNHDLCPPVDSCENEYASAADSQDAHQALAKSRGKQDAAQAESRRGKPTIPEKARTHLVYFAQAETGSPFKNYQKVTMNNNEKLEETIDKKYLSSIIQRQYETGEVRDGLSQISTPVCRDTIEPVVQAGISEDLCSCCEGQFFDLDHTNCREMTIQPTYAQNINRGNIYYDSNYYDVKPVKEQRNKNNKIIKKEGSDTDLTFSPEYYPFKPEYALNSKCFGPRAPFDTKSIKRCPKKKYHTRQVLLQNDSSQTDGLVEFSHVYSKRLPSKHKSRLKPLSRNAKCMAQIECNIGYMKSKLIQTSSLSKLSIPTNMNKPVAENDAYVGQRLSKAKSLVQPTKPLHTVSMTELTSKNIGLNKVTFKNAECLTLAFNETECQTDPLTCAQSEFVSPPEPNKTEATLEQIKIILQTVLTEVKTSQMQTIEEGKKTTEKIVQNEAILSPDSECFPGNITYRPFAINNSYQQMASCSRCLPAYRSSLMRQRLAMQPQAFEIPTDMGCVQNFPVFVHQPLATQQACCPERSAVMRPKQTSTNTLQEKPKKRTPETETLIKEIYKSMALNVDCPIPTTSCAALDETKPTNVRKDAPNEFRAANTTQDREEMIYRGNVATARREVKLTEHHSSHSLVNMRLQRRDSFFTSPRHTTSAMRREIQTKNLNNPDDAVEVKERLSEFASDVENDDVISQTSSTPTKPPKGFFGKVLFSVLKKMRKKEEQPSQKEQRKTRASYSDHDLGPPKPRRVKHVSYAPDNPRNARSVSPRGTTSQTRRLAYLNPPAAAAPGFRREQDRRNPPYHSPRMPRFAPRSALRAQPGSSQDRRAQYQPATYPKSSSFDLRRYPQNLNWRRMDACLSYQHEPYRARPRNAGIKLTNKTWMQKPVYHLGFACGPEKNKILMNY